MKNKFGFFGLLGFLGILGIIADNRAFLCFFGFFVYFMYFAVIPDELFRENVKKSATPAFFTSVFIIAITIAISSLFKEQIFLSLGLLISFIVSMLVFSILLITFEYKESRNG